MNFDYENSDHFFNQYNGTFNISKLKHQLLCWFKSCYNSTQSQGRLWTFSI